MTRGVPRRSVYTAAAMAAAAIALLPAAPAQARQSCTAARAGGHVYVKTVDAVVFAGSQESGGTYGCHRSGSHTFRFDTPSTEPRGFRLAGRYVAYAARIEEFMEPVFNTVRVFDLVRGRQKLLTSADSVGRVVVKRNGSAAWVQSSDDQPQDPAAIVWEVHRVSNEDGRGNVIVDRGAGIKPYSLTLAANRRAIAWTNAGERRSAPLP